MIGLDVGTSFIIASFYEGDNIVFKDFRETLQKCKNAESVEPGAVCVPIL